MERQYAQYGLAILLSAIVAAGATYAATDQTPVVEQKENTIETLEEKVTELETTAESYSETIINLQETLTEKEKEISELEGTNEQLQDQIDSAPSYEPVVEADYTGSFNVYSFTDSNNYTEDFEIEVNLPEEGSPSQTHTDVTLDYEYNVADGVINDLEFELHREDAALGEDEPLATSEPAQDKADSTVTFDQVNNINNVDYGPEAGEYEVVARIELDTTELDADSNENYEQREVTLTVEPDNRLYNLKR